MSKNAGLVGSVLNSSFGSCPPMSKLLPKNTYICPILFLPTNLFTFIIDCDNSDIIYI